jgi:predicted amidohydrolase YtcJ
VNGCQPADTFLENATIYTADEGLWTAEVLAIQDGRFVFIGSAEQGAPWRCGAEKILDVSGGFVFPGFTDSHQHLEGIGRRTRTLSLFNSKSLAETVSNIKAWADGIPEGDWVLGRGWIEREWEDEQRFLTREDVDAFTRNKPLYLPRADGVSALVNSKALALAGVNRGTPDPEGGQYQRDESGELTGYILGTAMDAVRAILPAETDEYLQENLLQGMQVNVSRGWTQTHDAGMSWRQVSLLRDLHRQRKMLHRIYIAVPVEEAPLLFEHGPEKSEDGFFDLAAIKVFIDGTLGSRGAALIEPYADADTRGFMDRTTREELMPVLAQALEDRIQIMTHVIGDRAVKSILDWYAAAIEASSSNNWTKEDLRWRLEHAQIIQPEDQVRMAEMGVIPSMQPSHAIGDLNFAPDRLGLERLQYAYPWRSLVDLGLPILAGSDAPVEIGDPRIEFYAAITRSRLDGSQDEGWHPEFAVSRAEALKMFTLWPAYGAFQESERGSITVGKRADLSIFDTDFMTANPQAILKAETRLTIVSGNIAYDGRKQN